MSNRSKLEAAGKSYGGFRFFNNLDLFSKLDHGMAPRKVNAKILKKLSCISLRKQGDVALTDSF